MGIILAFIVRHLDKVVAVGIVLVVLGFAYVTGRKHERQVWQPKYDGLVATYKAASDAAQAQIVATESAAKDSRDRVVAHYEERVHANNAALQSALDRLRVSTRTRTLAPAATAPDTCRTYEASATQLSEQDREFLVREAARADAVASQLNSLIEYTTDLHRLVAAQ